MTTTTILPYNREPIDTLDLIDFDPEPGPLPDAIYQEPLIFEIMHMLWVRLSDYGRRPDVFISSNTFICYDRSNLNVRISPDCYIASGVDTQAIRNRWLYLPWEAGKPPDFAIEVASRSTGRHDVTRKRDIYARIGVTEYWRFDATGGDYYGDPLAGDRLVDGEYRPIEMTVGADGLLGGYSPTIGLRLCWSDGRLLFHDPNTGLYLRNQVEDGEEHEAIRLALESQRDAYEETLRAREADQTRIRHLEEQLRRLREEQT